LGGLFAKQRQGRGPVAPRSSLRSRESSPVGNADAIRACVCSQLALPAATGSAHRQVGRKRRGPAKPGPLQRTSG
jgi:hypothetical protein